MNIQETRLNVRSPRQVNHRIRRLLWILGLDESEVVRLKYTAPKLFEPEPGDCHVNGLVQCHKAGGTLQHGWIFAEDAAKDFAEAQFHTVWCAPGDGLCDITPRADGEMRLMFVPDPDRSIILSDHNGQAAVITYDNVRVHRDRFLSGIERIKIVPQSKLIFEHGLFGPPSP